MHVKLALVLLCLHIYIADAANDDTDYLGKAPKDLQYSFVIFRHGIRSPIGNIYHSEPEYNKVWPNGKQQLTTNGKQLMERVGRSLKTRYQHLVPILDNKHIQITATSSPRAVQSAEHVVIGMYPKPEELTKYDAVGEWNPAKGKVTEFPYDKFDLFDQNEHDTKCKRYTQLRDAIKKEEMKKLSWTQRKIIKVLNKQIKRNNLPIQPIHTLDDLFNVWDTYEMMLLDGKTLPTWVTLMMPQMTNIAQYRLWMRMHGKTDGPHSILQYYTGPLLYQIIQEAAERNSICTSWTLLDDDPKSNCVQIHLHGSHDLTVGALVWAMLDKADFMAYPGDTLILEANSRLHFELYLYSPLNPEDKFKKLSLKSLCKKKSCSFQPFIRGLKGFGLVHSEEKWKETCNKGLTSSDKSKWRKRKVNLLFLIFKRILKIFLLTSWI